MNIPTIVIAAQDVFGFNLLRVQHLLTACLSLDVIGYSAFAGWIRKSETAEDMLHRRRRNRAFATRTCPTFLSLHLRVFPLAFQRETILDVRHIGHVTPSYQ